MCKVFSVFGNLTIVVGSNRSNDCGFVCANTSNEKGMLAMRFGINPDTVLRHVRMGAWL